MKEINQKELALVSGGISDEINDGVKLGAWAGGLLSMVTGLVYTTSPYYKKNKAIEDSVIAAVFIIPITCIAIGATIGYMNSPES